MAGQYVFALLIGIGALIAACALGIILGFPFSRWLSTRFAEFLIPLGERFRKPPPAYSTARRLTHEHRYKEAAEAYKSILEEHKDDETALLELARLYDLQMEDRAGAIRCYDRLERTARERSSLLFALERKAEIHAGMGDYGLASAELTKIMKRFPRSRDSELARERLKRYRR